MRRITIREELKRIRAGYSPKSKSFWIWLIYGINGALELIQLRIRQAFDDL